MAAGKKQSMPISFILKRMLFVLFLFSSEILWAEPLVQNCRRLYSSSFIKHFVNRKSFEDRLSDLTRMNAETNSKKEIDKNIRKLLKEASAKLRGGKVLFRMDPKNPRILILLPRAEGARLNRFASGLNRKFKVLAKDENGLLIEYNPASLFELKAGALFDSESFRYSISHDEIMALNINEFTVHEVRHAYNFIKALRDGIDHVYLGTVRNSETGTPFSETYPHEFSIDELPAFVLQINQQLRNLKRAQAIKDNGFIEANKEFNLQLIQTVRSLNDATKAFSHLFLEALSSMKRNNSDWIYKRNLAEGSKAELSSIEWLRSHDNSKIEISESPMIGARPEIGKYFTKISIETPEGSLEVQVIGQEMQSGLKDRHQETLQKAKIKVQALLEVTQFNRERLEKLESLVKVENWDEALSLASELRGKIELISLIPQSKAGP